MLQHHRNNELRMSDAEFRMFASLVRDHCGLEFASNSRARLEKRLVRRLLALGLSSFTAYHWRLRYPTPGDDELANLVDELTTCETFFFRQSAQLRALVDQLFVELKHERETSGGGPIRIWSAGCAGGEEPYSVVLMAREAGFEPGRDFRVYASDISRRMLEKARRGTYREGALRDVDPALRDRYFSEQNRRWLISDEIRRHVDFAFLNLLDRSTAALLDPMDVILCRNVLGHLAPDSRRRVVETLYEKLAPGGHLLLGPEESLVDASTAFELRHVGRDLVYRRVAYGGATPAARPPAASTAQEQAGGGA